MRQKTVTVEDVALRNGVVEYIKTEYTDDDKYPHGISKWLPSRIRIGALCLLIGRKDVSPNGIRDGATEKFSLDFRNTDRGVPGNTNSNICRYHGWRGTTGDISKMAYGLRKVIRIATVRGEVHVTVGRDIHPDWE